MRRFRKAGVIVKLGVLNVYGRIGPKSVGREYFNMAITGWSAPPILTRKFTYMLGYRPKKWDKCHFAPV